MTEPAWRLLVFGASGAIGRSVTGHARARDWSVICVTRDRTHLQGDDDGWIAWDPMSDDAADALSGQSPFDAVCWAQGANTSDSLAAFDVAAHLELYRANVLHVLQSAAALVSLGLLSTGGARLVVVSSIWQERARADKLSYTVTKTAIGGFVRAASVDLAPDGHLVNGVLPGVLDTPMTRANLSGAQIASAAGQTLHDRLPDLDTLAETILFLCSQANKSISGQSIAVDLGMSNAKLF